MHQDVLSDPTVAKLLTLTIRSESDAEATAAFGKARILHRKNTNLSLNYAALQRRKCSARTQGH